MLGVRTVGPVYAPISQGMQQPRAGSDCAPITTVHASIQVVRAFVRLRELLASSKDLAHRLDTLERKYDGRFKVVFDAIRQLMTRPEPRVPRMGFHVRKESI